MNLIHTKLFFPPTRMGLIPRPHLVERLLQGLQGKLTLISAPAGSGKTTLVSEWRSSLGHELPAAWLTLDAGDNDQATFLAYLYASLEQLQPGLLVQTQGMRTDSDGEGFIPGMVSSNKPDMHQVISFSTALTGLLNKLNQFNGHFVLILDDYHHITARTIHNVVEFIISHAPHQMHLVLLTRADPPLPLARLRADGQLTEIRLGHLRFSLEETRRFLGQVMGLCLNEQDIASLDARTEGWAAGLHLAALSLQGHSTLRQSELVAEFTGSHRYIFDYLADQVLDRQPPEIREFLLTTSILDRLNGELCNILRGESDSQELLEQLEQANLFLIPLDSQRIWYRYHPLFSDFLRRIQRQTNPATWLNLHSKAVQWYESKGMLSHAIQYALAVGDYAAASRLIEKVLRVVFEREGIGIMLRWLRALPREMVISHPVLTINYAWALAHSGNLDEVEPLIMELERKLGDEPQVFDDLENPVTDIQQASGGFALRQRLPIIIDLLHTFVERFRDLSLARKYVQQGLEKIPATNKLDRCVALMFKGHIHLLEGNSLGALQALHESLHDSELIHYTSVYLSAINYLCQQYGLMGRLQETELLCKRATYYIEQLPESILAGIEHIRLAEILIEWNDLSAAENHLKEGLSLAEEGGDFVFLREGYCVMARLQQAHGDLDVAATWLNKAEFVSHQTERCWGIAPIKARQARLAILNGNLDKAQRWADLSGLSGNEEFRFTNEYNLITLARLYLARGYAEQALSLLEQLYIFTSSSGRFGRVIEILVLQAIAAQTLGYAEVALEALSQALRLARPEGYLRLFIDEGDQLIRLLTILDRQQPIELHGYCARIINAVYPLNFSKADTRKQALIVSPKALLIEPLSRREIEVLRLIAAGRSNREIACELYIALGTVKRHTVNIFNKLDAANRIQAVTRARELELI